LKAELQGIDKFFGPTHALRKVDFKVPNGKCIGLIGHNGAGKTTLMNILSGVYKPSAGDIYIDSALQKEFSITEALRQGIRYVFQGLSLCQNLTVAENLMYFHRDIAKRGWKKKSTAMIIDKLNEIFPNNSIKANYPVSRLSLTQRQMIEIARGFSTSELPLNLTILDEPTSSLDAESANQLIEYIHTVTRRGMGVIFVSHRLDEVLRCADEVVVMKNGTAKEAFSGAGVAKGQLLGLMEQESVDDSKIKRSDFSISVEYSPEPLIAYDAVEPPITLHRGEVIGLAGLAGHGQSAFLLRMFAGDKSFKINGKIGYIPGDREKDGIFPLWSVAENISAATFGADRKWGFLIDRDRERAIAENWQEKVHIVTSSLGSNILSLSGGNQQKTLFARALESESDIILMDDPTKGVDPSTKEIIYSLIQDEKNHGRGFVWYSTEIFEMNYCDTVIVFFEGQIASVLTGKDISEGNILKHSFMSAERHNVV
jgi:ribose transport system ATP-binding protein